jgi:hypothetical protein
MAAEVSSIVDRPPLVWPGGARVAVWLIPNIEYYEMYPQPNSAANPYPRTAAPEFLE